MDNFFSLAARHPIATATAVVNAIATSFLGPAWIVPLLLRAFGFGALGPVAGMSSFSLLRTELK
jgi:hypothetical protein